MIYKLIIKNADETVFWSQKFETLEKLNKWLAQEQTRSYWKPEFTTEIQEIPLPALPTWDQTKLTQLQALRQRLNALDEQTDLTAAELKEMARKFFRFLKLKGLLD